MWLWYQPSPLFGCDIVEFIGWCSGGLKPATRYVGSGASWEGFFCRPSSGTICALLVTTSWELQIELQSLAASAGLRGTWE